MGRSPSRTHSTLEPQWGIGMLLQADNREGIRQTSDQRAVHYLLGGPGSGPGVGQGRGRHCPTLD